MKPILCALTAVFLAAPAILGAAQAKDNGTGPTLEQIHCQNRAVNDYWDEIKGCERSLSDLPDQLALCKQDAMDELRRDQAACMAASTRGGWRPVFSGGVFERVR